MSLWLGASYTVCVMLDTVCVIKVLAHPFMTACSPKPRWNEVEEEVKSFVAGNLKPDESKLLGQVRKLSSHVCTLLLLLSP
jgi:hypothetical protein